MEYQIKAESTAEPLNTQYFKGDYNYCRVMFEFCQLHAESNGFVLDEVNNENTIAKYRNAWGTILTFTFERNSMNIFDVKDSQAFLKLSKRISEEMTNFNFVTFNHFHIILTNDENKAFYRLLATWDDEWYVTIEKHNNDETEILTLCTFNKRGMIIHSDFVDHTSFVVISAVNSAFLNSLIFYNHLS